MSRSYTSFPLRLHRCVVGLLYLSLVEVDRHFRDDYYLRHFRPDDVCSKHLCLIRGSTSVRLHGAISQKTPVLISAICSAFVLMSVVVVIHSTVCILHTGCICWFLVMFRVNNDYFLEQR
jgi:hypothetical protein